MRTLTALVVLFFATSLIGAEPKTSARVDESLRAAWQREKITPAPAVDDAGFLRRVCLDLTGTLPTPERVQSFVADRSADKRAKLVDESLASEAYAAHWADYWDAILMGRLSKWRAGSMRLLTVRSISLRAKTSRMTASKNIKPRLS